MVHRIYPVDLQLNLNHYTNAGAPFLALNLPISNAKVTTQFTMNGVILIWIYTHGKKFGKTSSSNFMFLKFQLPVVW